MIEKTEVQKLRIKRGKERAKQRREEKMELITKQETLNVH